ncbi:ATP-binding protein [Actinomadura sp. HBU206391]|uniref:ATP-binding protein n=1 Tax=Actinomadura sp. HBU206391 TaxID=2731692 RepID=UPI00165066DE|nr:ATP-binding protein [Actinomadura sp. HBU206391]MBC6462412.1 ATP-binding protein [Actinomadura sp. HBU206391]
MDTTDHTGTDTQIHARSFPGTRDQIRTLRRFIREHLPTQPDAELIASELGTNAIEHTRSGRPGGVFRARIHSRPDGTARLEIEDDGGPALFGPCTHGREGGRGLILVAAYTTAWGVTGDQAGRTTWAELPR